MRAHGILTTIVCVTLSCLSNGVSHAFPGTANGQGSAMSPDLLSKPIKLSGKALSIFNALTQIEPQLGRALMVDGESIVSAADFEISGPAKSVLDNIAERYDFTWELSRKGIILFVPRFQFLDSVPQLNQQEMKATVDDIVAMMSVVSPDLNTADAVYFRELGRRILQSKQGTPTLSAKRLSPSELGLLTKALCGVALTGPYVNWLGLKAALRWDRPAEVATRVYADTSGSKFVALGVEGPEPVIQRFGIYPVVMRWTAAETLFRQNGVISGVITEEDPSWPTEAIERTENAKTGVESPGANPVAGLVTISIDRGNLSRLTAEIGRQVNFPVMPDQSIANHLVTIIANRVRYLDLMESLGDLGDWRMSYGTTHIITRRKVILPRDLGELSDRLPFAMPRDLRRYLGFDCDPDVRNPNLTTSDRRPLDPRFVRVELLSRIKAQIQSYIDRKGPALLRDAVTGDATKGAIGTWMQPISALKPRQNRLLLKLLILKQIVSSLGGVGAALFTGRLDPYYRDPSTAQIRVTPQEIHVYGPAFDVPGGMSSIITSMSDLP